MERYVSLSRSPRYSLVFALPLLVLYECLTIATTNATGGMRNGADVLLQELWHSIAGPMGPLIFSALLLVYVMFLVVRDLRRNAGGLRFRVFVTMLAESALLAALFGMVVGAITARLVATALPLALGPLDRVGFPAALALSLGAGLYEELLFRVLLVGALMAAARLVFGAGPRASRVFAVVVSAVIFSAFHYVGPYGDTLVLSSFVFRAIAGLAFSGLYVTRGFGITAWTHALYDIFLLIARS